MKLRVACLFAAATALAGCGSLLDSKLAAPQSYVLRLPAREATTPANTQPAGSVLLQRPKAGPGLDSDRIVLLRSDSRFDFYAASRWIARSRQAESHSSRSNCTTTATACCISADRLSPNSNNTSRG